MASFGVVVNSSIITASIHRFKNMLYFFTINRPLYAVALTLDRALRIMVYGILPITTIPFKLNDGEVNAFLGVYVVLVLTYSVRFYDTFVFHFHLIHNSVVLFSCIVSSSHVHRLLEYTSPVVFDCF